MQPNSKSEAEVTTSPVVHLLHVQPLFPRKGEEEQSVADAEMLLCRITEK